MGWAVDKVRCHSGVVEISRPVVPPRSHPAAENAKGWVARRRGSGGGTWGKIYHYFQFRREEFLTHYHKRSNVESAFSMMKRKLGDGLRSKTDVATTNETLCKYFVTIWSYSFTKGTNLGLTRCFGTRPQ